MRVRLFFLLFPVVLTLISCGKEEGLPTPQPKHEVVSKPETLADKLAKFEQEQPPTHLSERMDVDFHYRLVNRWLSDYVDFYNFTGSEFDLEQLRIRADVELVRRRSMVEKLSADSYFERKAGVDLNQGGSFVVSNIPEFGHRYYPGNRENTCYNTDGLRFLFNVTDIPSYQNKGWISRSSVLRSIRTVVETRANTQNVDHWEVSDSWGEHGRPYPVCGNIHMQYPSVLDDLRSKNPEYSIPAVKEIARLTVENHLSREDLVALGLTKTEIDVVFAEIQKGASK